jgi:hypothetical protein
MVHICKSDTGYIVATLADKNYEVLAVSEVLNSKQSCWKNVFAQMKIYGCPFVYVQDDCGKKSKMYKSYTSGYKYFKLEIAAATNPKYIPSSTKPKYLPKKK